MPYKSTIIKYLSYYNLGSLSLQLNLFGHDNDTEISWYFN